MTHFYMENMKLITNNTVFYKILFAHFKLFYADFASLLPFINHQARSTNQKLAKFFVLLPYPANKARYEQTLLTLLNKECLNFYFLRHENPNLKNPANPENLLRYCFIAFLHFAKKLFSQMDTIRYHRRGGNFNYGKIKKSKKDETTGKKAL